MYYVLYILFGLAVGSFLNVCIDRLPRHESLFHPPSHCDGCGRRLRRRDLIPVVSYILLRGRCRDCGSHLTLRVPLVEVATAALFTLLGWYYGPGAAMGLAWFFAALLLVIFVTDLEQQIIPNVIVYPAIALAFLVPWLTGSHDLISALIGASVGAGLLLPIAFFFPNGMGMGDVKLAALMGVLVGFPMIFVALLLGIVLGGLTAVFLLVTKRRGRKEALPLAPFLIVGLALAAFWGEPILRWYLPG